MEMCREKGEESSDEEQEQAGEPKGEGLALTASSGSELSLEKKIGPICFKLHRAGFRDRAGPLDCRHHCHRRGRIVFGCRGSREDGRCILPRPRGGQCSRSCRLVYPWAPGPLSTPLASGRRCDGDQVEFHLFCCLFFSLSTIAIAITSMAELALVSELSSAQVLAARAERPFLARPPRHIGWHSTRCGLLLWWWSSREMVRCVCFRGCLSPDEVPSISRRIGPPLFPLAITVPSLEQTKSRSCIWLHRMA